MKQSCYKYSIGNKFDIKISINNNEYDLNIDNLFCMAARKNLKRKFLFVSKVLGKHIPVNPKISLLTGRLLGHKYIEETYKINQKVSDLCDIMNKNECSENQYEQILNEKIDLPEETLIIGFAETATALGHSFFDSFKDKAHYIHTTRDTILTNNKPISFEEEHSHATSHMIYPIDTSILKSDIPIVFVDDEITTGKTTINIIESIQKKYPRKRYTIVSILDWRSKQDKEYFIKKEEELGVKIDTVSLVSGEIDYYDIKAGFFKDNNVLNDAINKTEIKYINLEDIFTDTIKAISKDTNGNTNDCDYLRFTGRFGIDSIDNNKIDNISRICGENLKNIRTGSKTLCLGTGEFMYIPMLIASYMGEGVLYHSTTRSPVYPSDDIGYALQNKYTFQSMKDSNIENYVYNIPQNYYDDIFIFIEREGLNLSTDTLIQAMKKTGAKTIYIVTHAMRRRGDMIGEA
ncbi:phosphoribosyltransferase family protein [Clostridiaceae bacterium M8S5]|nr:phosphoribosyltransferase family protein [Clostridiaceae bacterium M8S5]